MGIGGVPLPKCFWTHAPPPFERPVKNAGLTIAQEKRDLGDGDPALEEVRGALSPQAL